jgi:hypothetical protein
MSSARQGVANGGPGVANGGPGTDGETKWQVLLAMTALIRD